MDQKVILAQLIEVLAAAIAKDPDDGGRKLELIRRALDELESEYRTDR